MQYRAVMDVSNSRDPRAKMGLWVGTRLKTAVKW